MARDYLGGFIRATREQRGWSFGDFARACGAKTPRETSHISQRLVLFEREGIRNIPLLRKVIAALTLDVNEVNELLLRQRAEQLQEWEEWADEPVAPELACSIGEVSGVVRPLPPEITTEDDALKFAEEFSRNETFPFVTLWWNRRILHRFERGGKYLGRFEETNRLPRTPYITLGSSNKFIIKTESDGS